jgi:hypothetical protein
MSYSVTALHGYVVTSLQSYKDTALYRVGGDVTETTVLGS